jgi:hypothetical protein
VIWQAAGIDASAHILFADLPGGTADITTGLLHHWPMEQAAGTTVTDIGGTPETMDLINTPTWLGAGCIVGTNCLDLNGTTQYGEVLTPTLPQGSDPFTWSVWVFFDAYDGMVLTILDGAGVNNLAMFISPIAEGELFKVFQNLTQITWSTQVETGFWYLLTITRGSANGWSTYLNAELIRRMPETLTFSFSTCQLLMGTDADALCTGTLGNYLNGRVDDVRIYTRELTETDVRALYDLRN